MAVIGRSCGPSGMATVAVSWEVTTPCSWPQAVEPVATSSAYRPSSTSLIWCSARSASLASGPWCSATAGLTVASSSTPREATHAARRAVRGRVRAAVMPNSASSPSARSLNVSVVVNEAM